MTQNHQTVVPELLKANKGEGLELVRHIERALNLPPNWTEFSVHVVARGAIKVQVSYFGQEPKA